VGTGCSWTTWVSDGNVKYRVATSAAHAPMTISGRRTTKSPIRRDADRWAPDVPVAAFRAWALADFRRRGALGRRAFDRCRGWYSVMADRIRLYDYDAYRRDINRRIIELPSGSNGNPLSHGRE